MPKSNRTDQTPKTPEPDVQPTEPVEGQYEFRPDATQDSDAQINGEDYAPGVFQMTDPPGSHEEQRAGPGDAGRSDRPVPLDEPKNIGQRQRRASQFFWVAGIVVAGLAVLALLF